MTRPKPKDILPKARRKAPAKAAPPSNEAPASKPSKLAQLTTLLKRPEGMTIAQAIETTGWQAHSVRGALAGSIHKQTGLKVASEKVEGVRIYRLPA